MRARAMLANAGWLLAAWTAIGLLTALYVGWLGIAHPTTVALSFLLVVLIVAAISTLWVAIAASLMAFVCYNFFFLPPVGTFTIEDPENWVALVALLVVSIIGSHLSTQARRRAQEAMTLLEERKQVELLRRSAELKSALLASLQHDLKTPLTAVTVAASNLTASWLTADQRREQTDLILTELARLNRLFENLVEMARIETRAVAAEPEWVDPSELVDAAIRQVEAALRQHPVEVTLGAEKTFVRLDPRLTSAALAHILENAAQYSPPGSPIAISVALQGDELQIAVRDRGKGLAPADRERLFESFYRGAGAGEHGFGTGMGLAITRGLLAAEGGRAWSDNHPEGGAVFVIAVPTQTRVAAAIDSEAR